jgi:hypothetical protein
LKEKTGMLKRALAIAFGFVYACTLTGQSYQQVAHAQSQASSRVREVRSNPAAEVTVTLNEQFFNSLLDVIFTRLKAPSFPLSIAVAGPEVNNLPVLETQTPPVAKLAHAGAKPSACQSEVILEREISGVRTAVRFENGRVVAPLAFRGSYAVALLGCVNFQGWADTVINLNFDKERQVLSARVTIVDIHLSNIPSLASGVIVNLVQNSIDRRINPVEILQASQISTRLSITGSGGALRMRATEIRPVVAPGALSLHIFYEFTPSD